ncbi:MAG TPA: DMT family transporter [bacterium]|nr:DMT family transporter [bacterium]
MRTWGAFLLLGTIWGSSFLWIKIAVGEVGPATLAAFRLLFGSLGLLVVARLTRTPFREQLRAYFPAYLFMGFFNTALPFVLISWAETRIDSALAAILNATAPLFAIVIAHWWLSDEKITLRRLGGLVVGFGGVVVLMSREFSPQGVHGTIWGYAAMVAASASYGLSATFSRRHLRGHPPLVQATMVVLLADLMTWLVVPVMDRPVILPQAPVTWLALAWLGLLGSCVAYLLYFYLINAWGPTRASLVTYIFPVVGIALGVVFLNEALDWRLAAGAALIVGGIAVVNRPPAPAVRLPLRAERPQES